MIDLHLHTSASADAQHTPAELFAMAQAQDLRCVSFADHNTIDAIPAGIALAGAAGIEFIPAFELNTELDGRELHLLGYGFAPDAPAVRAWFVEIGARFRRQAEERVARFVALGLELTIDQVLAAAGNRLPTGSSFFDALVQTPANRRHPLLDPYVTGAKAADRYVDFYFEVMANGGPADVRAMAWPAREAVARCRAIGAAPVVAHPMDLPLSDLEKLIAAGLLGVEAICSYHAAAVQAHWQQAAAKYELLVTAGSDFHGARTKPGVRLGGLDGADYRLVERLRDAVAGLRRSA